MKNLISKISNFFVKLWDFIKNTAKKVWNFIKKIALIVWLFIKKIALKVWIFVKKIWLIVYDFLKKFFSKRKNVYITCGVAVVLILALILGIALGKPNNLNNNGQGQYTVTLIGDDTHGTINAESVTYYNRNDLAQIKFVPDTGYYLSNFKINNNNEAEGVTLNLLTVEGWSQNIWQNITIEYTFSPLIETMNYSATKVIPTSNRFSITSIPELIWFMQVVNGYGSPDLSETGIETTPYNFENKIVELNASLDMLGYKMYPIGNSEENAFRGTFSSGFMLENINITPSTDYCGFFGYIGENSNLTNIHLVNALIKGNNYVGGIAGKNYMGTISESSTSGVISGVDYVGGILGYNTNQLILKCSPAMFTFAHDYVGGVLGYGNNVDQCINQGRIYANSYVGGITGYGKQIQNSANTEMIIATGDYVGGITGKTYEGSIVGCFNRGLVKTSGSYAGGITGKLDLNSSIMNSYNRGGITATSYAGGIAGETYSLSAIMSYIAYCYNASAVTANEYYGAIVGKADSTITIGYCYYDNEYAISTLGTNLTEGVNLKGMTMLEMINNGLEDDGFSATTWKFVESTIYNGQTCNYFPQLKILADGVNQSLKTHSEFSAQIWSN